MRILMNLGWTMGLFSVALAVACGDAPPPSTVEGGGASAGAGHTQGASSNLGGLDLGGNINGSGGASSASGNGFGADGTGGGCAAATEQAELAPVYLVFLLDESGSMGDGEHGDRAVKWDPVTSALNAFYADPSSAGITASLSLFPLNQNTGTGPAVEDQPADCDAMVYGTPEVPPRALPDDNTFADAIAKLDPPNEFGTPTLPALTGTIAYAESLLQEDSTRKVAIVMVTDGDPVSCKDNTIDNTAKAAAAVADHIPTYVIGVGDSLTSLNAIAAGGGTDKAFIVSLNDPAQTRKELLDAINLIRGKSIACDLPLPSPPAGKKLDPDKVSVQFTASGQDGTPLQYGTACAGDTAWHYDDAAHPTEILLCDDTCSTVKADPLGKLDVVFGCVDRKVVQ